MGVRTPAVPTVDQGWRMSPHQLLEPPQLLEAGAAEDCCSPALAAAQSLVSVWADQSSVTWYLN